MSSTTTTRVRTLTKIPARAIARTAARPCRGFGSQLDHGRGATSSTASGRDGHVLGTSAIHGRSVPHPDTWWRGPCSTGVAPSFLPGRVRARQSIVFAGAPGRADERARLRAAELDPSAPVVVAEVCSRPTCPCRTCPRCQTRPQRPTCDRRPASGWCRASGAWRPTVALVARFPRPGEALPLLLTLSSGVKGFTTPAGSARQALTPCEFTASWPTRRRICRDGALTTWFGAIDGWSTCARVRGVPGQPRSHRRGAADRPEGTAALTESSPGPVAARAVVTGTCRGAAAPSVLGSGQDLRALLDYDSPAWSTRSRVTASFPRRARSYGVAPALLYLGPSGGRRHPPAGAARRSRRRGSTTGWCQAGLTTCGRRAVRVSACWSGRRGAGLVAVRLRPPSAATRAAARSVRSPRRPGRRGAAPALARTVAPPHR